MADTTKRVTEEEIREALRAVLDPEIGLNVIELGLIRKIEIHEDRTHVVMMMTTPFCPYAQQLLEQTRQTAQEAAGLPATIEMSTELWEPSFMEEGAGADWGLF